MTNTKLEAIKIKFLQETLLRRMDDQVEKRGKS